MHLSRTIWFIEKILREALIEYLPFKIFACLPSFKDLHFPASVASQHLKYLNIKYDVFSILWTLGTFLVIPAFSLLLVLVENQKYSFRQKIKILRRKKENWMKLELTLLFLRDCQSGDELIVYCNDGSLPNKWKAKSGEKVTSFQLTTHSLIMLGLGKYSIDSLPINIRHCIGRKEYHIKSLKFE